VSPLDIKTAAKIATRASEGFFQGGATRGFFKIFWGGKSSEICFFPLETKKTTFLCCNFQNPGGAKAPPSDTHVQQLIFKQMH